MQKQRSSLFGLALLAVAVLAGAAWLVSRGPRHDSAIAKASDVVAVADPSDGARDSDGAPLGAPSRVELDEPAVIEPGEPATRAANSGSDAPVATGRVRVAVEDALTRAAIDRFTLRALSDERLATSAGRGSVEMELRPGRYEALVLAQGYDSLELTPFEVAAGEERDLGTVAIHRGTASVSGTVDMTGRSPEDVARIELRGDGRNPCFVCEGAAGARCAECGFGASMSMLEVPFGSTFRFDQLAAGHYVLVARDASRRILTHLELQLAPGEARVANVDIECFDLVVAIQDAEGAPFDGSWLEDGVVYQDRMRLHLWADGRPSAATSITPSAAGAVDLHRAAEEAAAERRRDAATKRSPSPPPAGESEELLSGDVPRAPSHTLWPTAIETAPSLRTSALAYERLDPGLYRLLEVPAASDGIQVTAGLSFSDRVPIPESALRGEPVVLRLLHECPISSRAMAESRSSSCTSCHALPDLLLPE